MDPQSFMSCRFHFSLTSQGLFGSFFPVLQIHPICWGHFAKKNDSKLESSEIKLVKELHGSWSHAGLKKPFFYSSCICILRSDGQANIETLASMEVLCKAHWSGFRKSFRRLWNKVVFRGMRFICFSSLTDFILTGVVLFGIILFVGL